MVITKLEDLIEVLERLSEQQEIIASECYSARRQSEYNKETIKKLKENIKELYKDIYLLKGGKNEEE